MKSQNTTAQNQGNTGAFSTIKAVNLLAKLALDRASSAELEYLSYAVEQAAEISNTLSAQLMRTGCVFGSKDDIHSGSEVADLLFSASYLLEHVNLLSLVGTEAAYKLNERKGGVSYD